MLSRLNEPFENSEEFRFPEAAIRSSDASKQFYRNEKYPVRSGWRMLRPICVSTPGADFPLGRIRKSPHFLSKEVLYQGRENGIIFHRYQYWQEDTVLSD